MLYLRVENKVSHIPDIDLLCTIGESTSRGNNDKIGQFGSGFKYMLALFAREGILDMCKFCLGLDVYNPVVKGESKKGSSGESVFVNKIYLKKQNGGTYDLNISTRFGAIDWTNVTMGVREIISNAFDGAVTYNGKYDSVKIEKVMKNQCRADDGTIRVYIPLTSEIEEYIGDIDKNFICMNKNYNPGVAIIDKDDNSNVIIYKQGVKVSQEYQKSLFDYNIDVKVDESRIVDRGEAREKAAHALRDHGTEAQLEKYFREIVINQNEDMWEYRFDSWDLNPRYAMNPKEAKEKFGKSAAKALDGSIPCANDTTSKMIKSKGLNPVNLKSESFYEMFKECVVKLDINYLDENEALGNTIIEPTHRVVCVRDYIWDHLSTMNLTNGKDKPEVKCFNSAINAGTKTLGYHILGTKEVLIHQDISDDNGLQLYKVMLEELGHYITGAKDFTRDFQDFFVSLSATLLKNV